jgi:hypothetical protein
VPHLLLSDASTLILDEALAVYFTTPVLLRKNSAMWPVYKRTSTFAAGADVAQFDVGTVALTMTATWTRPVLANFSPDPAGWTSFP